MNKTLLSILIMGFFSTINAECINGVKEDYFSILDENTIILQQNEGIQVVIELDCHIKDSSSLILLQKSFCDYYDGVLSVDNKPCTIEKVMRLES